MSGMFNGAPHVDPGSEIWDFLSGKREDDKAIKCYLGISIMPGTTVCRLVPHKAPPAAYTLPADFNHRDENKECAGKCAPSTNLRCSDKCVLELRTRRIR